MFPKLFWKKKTYKNWNNDVVVFFCFCMLCSRKNENSWKTLRKKHQTSKPTFWKNDKFWWFSHVLYFYFFIPRILLVFHKWWQKNEKPLLKDFYDFSFLSVVHIFWRDHDFAPSEFLYKNGICHNLNDFLSSWHDSIWVLHRIFLRIFFVKLLFFH